MSKLEVPGPHLATAGTVCLMTWKCLLHSYSLGIKFCLNLDDHLSPGPEKEHHPPSTPPLAGCFRNFLLLSLITFQTAKLLMSPSCPINYHVGSEVLSMASRPRRPKPHPLSTVPCSPHLPCSFTSCLCSPRSFYPECLSSSFLPGELLLYLQIPSHLFCETHSLPSR